jgi:hypothetical protein
VARNITRIAVKHGAKFSDSVNSIIITRGSYNMKPYVLIAVSFAVIAPIQAHAASTILQFPLKVSPGASSCLPKASGSVIVHTLGSVESLEVTIRNLPPNIDFVVFNIQIPNAPFGLAWYNGDILTDDTGTGVTNIVGRFNHGTFIVSPGAVPSPPVFPDNSTTGVATAPVQIYHLGVWFNSPGDAVNAGCPGTVTPFTSNHHAGIQVLNTAPFPNNKGPLFPLGD